jgi:hypothetical protein
MKRLVLTPAYESRQARCDFVFLLREIVRLKYFAGAQVRRAANRDGAAGDGRELLAAAFRPGENIYHLIRKRSNAGICGVADNEHGNFDCFKVQHKY